MRVKLGGGVFRGIEEVRHGERVRNISLDGECVAALRNDLRHNTLCSLLADDIIHHHSRSKTVRGTFDAPVTTAILFASSFTLCSSSSGFFPSAMTSESLAALVDIRNGRCSAYHSCGKALHNGEERPSELEETAPRRPTSPTSVQ